MLMDYVQLVDSARRNNSFPSVSTVYTNCKVFIVCRKSIQQSNECNELMCRRLLKTFQFQEVARTAYDLFLAIYLWGRTLFVCRYSIINTHSLLQLTRQGSVCEPNKQTIRSVWRGFELAVGKWRLNVKISSENWNWLLLVNSNIPSE